MRIEKSNSNSNPAPGNFLRAVFKSLQASKPYDIHSFSDSLSVQQAISHLRKQSRMTVVKFSERLCISTTRLTQLESRGLLRTEEARRLQGLAVEFELPNLAKKFYQEMLMSMRSRKERKEAESNR